MQKIYGYVQVSSGKIDELLIDAFREDIAFGLEEDDQEGEIID